MGGLFAKGTKPERDFTIEEVKVIDAALFPTYEQFEADVKQGTFLQKWNPILRQQIWS